MNTTQTRNGSVRIAGVVITYGSGTTSEHTDIIDAAAHALSIDRYTLRNLLMAATFGNVDEVAAGLATRYRLPLEPVEQALGILEELSERKAAMDQVRAARVAGLGDIETLQQAMMEAAGDYRALANLLEELAKEVVKA